MRRISSLRSVPPRSFTASKLPSAVLARLELLASPHFYKKNKVRAGAILCRTYVFPWSRTASTLPAENPRPSHLARISAFLPKNKSVRVNHFVGLASLSTF